MIQQSDDTLFLAKHFKAITLCDGWKFFKNIKDCIKTLKDDNVKSVFIIGGSSIYSKFLNKAHNLGRFLKNHSDYLC